MMEYDVHTLLDGMTLVATVGVLYCMVLPREIAQTYQREQVRVA